MILTDRQIKDRIKAGELITKGYEPNRLKCISYDINIEAIISDEREEQGFYKSVHEYYLQSGETIYVKGDIHLKMPLDCVGIVYERNSVMRKGFVVDGPCYQPGHETNVFLRVHNIYANEQVLRVGEGIAQIRFEQLSAVPAEPYTGENEAYQNEEEYRGVQGDLKHGWDSQIVRYERKVEELDRKENRIYANVLTFMGLFITLFSLLTFNYGQAASGFNIKNLLMIDFSICMIMCIFMGIILLLVNNVCKKKPMILYWIVVGLLLAVNIVLWILWI